MRAEYAKQRIVGNLGKVRWGGGGGGKGRERRK